MHNKFTGIVTRSTGSWYEVLSEGKTYSCRMRGKLRLKGFRSTNPIVVGDTVHFESDDNDSYVIYDIAPRRNYVIRRASNLSKESHIIGSNIDQALIVATLANPVTALEFIDRFLVTCEAYKVPVIILLTKIDLTNTESAKAFHSVYEMAGYRVLDVSSTEDIGIDKVKEILANKTTLVAGNSGVGKSTLIKAVDPTLNIRIGDISDSHHKGKHTTTYSTMYPIVGNGYIIDTPGIKGFGLIDIADAELWHYFPEFMRYSSNCQFYNCTHTHEPKCAILNAVKNGEISDDRYESYLKILSEDEKYR